MSARAAYQVAAGARTLAIWTLMQAGLPLANARSRAGAICAACRASNSPRQPVRF